MTSGDNAALANVAEALSKQFSLEEARCLAQILSGSFMADSISYDDLDLDPDMKDDMILLAYEKRILLPMKSRRGSAWEDRILTFEETERYHLPRVVRFLIENAKDTGEWNTEPALIKALEEAGEDQIEAIISYLNKLMKRAPKFELEVGVMQAIAAELGLEIDMHDTLDRFVRCGILSPRTQRSLHTGFSKYEMNPSLYWKSRD
ncbi:MAG: hypothetical protein HOC20_06960 [Chloroflexi bacterium]|jgi:hypothetical protein|nr:hypothetical protein [Chloroflexota bacterium]